MKARVWPPCDFSLNPRKVDSCNCSAVLGVTSCMNEAGACAYKTPLFFPSEKAIKAPVPLVVERGTGKEGPGDIPVAVCWWLCMGIHMVSPFPSPKDIFYLLQKAC